MAYDAEVKEKIRDRYERGESPSSISSTKGYPNQKTIENWAKAEQWSNPHAMIAKESFAMRKYADPFVFEQRILEYFDSLYEPVYREKEIMNQEGNTVIRRYPLEDEFGAPVLQMTKKPTITGMCLFLKMDRDTFYNYLHGKNDKHLPEGSRTFSEVAKMANEYIIEYNEQALYDPKSNKGAEFILNVRNNMVKKTKVEESDNGKRKLEDFF